MSVYFTADLHLGHENIIDLCSRPFEKVAEMDRALAAQWNAVVRPEDTIYVLGDFAYRSRRSVDSYLAELNGTKHLIIGNHDDANTLKAKGWASVQPYLEIAGAGRKIVLCHYPMRAWHGSYRDSWMLHGHCHGRMAAIRQSCDVGVDAWHYTPVGYPQLMARMEKLQSLPKPERWPTKDDEE